MTQDILTLRKKVLIVTPDILGPVKNGGIGTAYACLAQHLEQDGHYVTILFTSHTLDNESEQQWKVYYRERGINFLSIKQSSPASVSGLFGDALRLMRDTYETLLTLGPIDIIHAPDWRGHIYYALIAKHLGLAFTDTIFCVTAHAPSLWALNGNQQTISTKTQLITIAVEKHLYAMADVLVSPSAYMLKWLSSRQFKLSSNQVVLPNLMPKAPPPQPKRSSLEVKELVFFGRLEKRKGLDLFVEAIDRLHAKGLGQNLDITFMGKETTYGMDLLERSTGKWPNQVKTILDYDSSQALDYLSKNESRLAVIPSLSDNSPYTVLECLSLHIPFLATDVGGVRELIQDDEADSVLFKPFSKFFAAKLEEVLTNGYDFASLAFDLAVLRSKWTELHENELAPAVNERQAPSPAPLVSVCIPHHDRPKYLEQALQSIDKQTYPNIEVIVVDDGSKENATDEYLQGQETYFGRADRTLVRQDNLHGSVSTRGVIGDKASRS